MAQRKYAFKIPLDVHDEILDFCKVINTTPEAFAKLATLQLFEQCKLQQRQLIDAELAKLNGGSNESNVSD